MNRPLFLDLFAGAGGLSEGFARAGFEPLAHVEVSTAACSTLRTRMAYYWLRDHESDREYRDYLKGVVTRSEFYGKVPEKVLQSVINAEIGEGMLPRIFQEVDELLGKRKLDLIIGGPPCQTYSLVGRSRDRNRMRGDKRNYLYRYYAEFLKRYSPLCFVFENVTGLLSARDEDGNRYFDNMRSLFLECGYETEFRTLSAEDYGVLQSRRRIILVGRRRGCAESYPEPERYNPGVCVGEIFADLPPLHSGEGNTGPCVLKPYHGQWLYDTGIKDDVFPVTWHQARPNTEQDLEIYRIAVQTWNSNRTRLDYNSLPECLKTHRNRDSFLDRFKVVAADLPFSHTVVAHISKDGHYYIHPDIDQNRSITPREAARLQTFPDNYYFESSNGRPGRTPAFRQIGNAVPVLLAYKIAEKLREVYS